MTALALGWFEDESPRDLMRWVLAAAVVLGIHAGGIGLYLVWHQAEEIGDDAGIVTVDFVASDIDQPEVAPEPETPQKLTEEQPPLETPTDVAALPEQKPVEEEKKPPPPPPMPARSTAIAARIVAPWESSVVRHLQRFKRYPSEALSHSEEGTVVLRFSVDRDGHVLARHVEQSSGHADLDDEVMAMIARADPLPAFPANMPQSSLELTVPVRFSMH